MFPIFISFFSFPYFILFLFWSLGWVVFVGVGVGWGGWGRQGKHFHRNGSPVEKVRIDPIKVMSLREAEYHEQVLKETINRVQLLKVKILCLSCFIF